MQKSEQCKKLIILNEKISLKAREFLAKAEGTTGKDCKIKSSYLTDTNWYNLPEEHQVQLLTKMMKGELSTSLNFLIIC